MNPRILLSLAVGLILALTAVCFSADTQERVAPVEDTARLHLSVVGVPGSAQYQNVLTWFKSDSQLSALRESTHFHPVAAGTAMYDERYRPNIHGLPTIRLQDGKGMVLYESWGSNVPASPKSLADEIERKTSQILKRPLLPWRKKIEQQCSPENCGPRNDEITPEDLMQDEFPVPDAFTPVPDIEPESEGIPTWVCIALAAASAAGGFVGAIVGKIKQEIQA